MTGSRTPPHAAEHSEEPLYRAAIEVEEDASLAAEMAEWEAARADGLEEDEDLRKPLT